MVHLKPRLLVLAIVFQASYCGGNSVIQRMPPGPGPDEPDPAAASELNKVMESSGWHELATMYTRISMMAPTEDYARRESVLDNAMSEVKRVLSGMERNGWLHYLVKKDLEDAFLEIALYRLKPKPALDYLSSRQMQRLQGLERLLAAAHEKVRAPGRTAEQNRFSRRAMAQWNASCGLLDLVDVIRSAQLAPICEHGSFDPSIIVRFPLDVRVAARILLELESVFGVK